MAKIRDTATASTARIRSRPGVPDRDRRREVLTSSTRPATVGTLAAWLALPWLAPLWFGPVVWPGLVVWLTAGFPVRPDRGPAGVSDGADRCWACLLYTSPSPRDRTRSR